MFGFVAGARSRYRLPSGENVSPAYWVAAGGTTRVLLIVGICRSQRDCRSVFHRARAKDICRPVRRRGQPIRLHVCWSGCRIVEMPRRANVDLRCSNEYTTESSGGSQHNEYDDGGESCAQFVSGFRGLGNYRAGWISTRGGHVASWGVGASGRAIQQDGV